MGTTQRNTIALGIALLAVSTLLTGCTGTTQAAQTTTRAAETPTATPTDGPSNTPRPTSTISQVPGVDYDGGTVPATCEGLLTPGRWDDSFAQAPLNDPQVVGSPAQIPKSVFDPVLQPDGKRLYCVWRDPRADISFLSIEVDVVDSSKSFGVLQALDGFTCTHDAEGYRCQKVGTDEQYGVETGTTYFTRGDVAITVEQANVPTSGLLDDVMSHVF